jgi:hypothetical protein
MLLEALMARLQLDVRYQSAFCSDATAPVQLCRSIAASGSRFRANFLH